MRRLSLAPCSPSRRPRSLRILSAVCHVRVTTSPTRPIAWLSLAMMLMAPRSCSTSSAAMVCPRMRLSAKATSSGAFLSRWWHTMSMSRCSSRVLTVYGRVGVGRARQHVGLAADADDVGRVPPAGPLGVVGVDGPSLERGHRDVDEPRLVQGVGVDGDLDVEAVRLGQAAVDGGRGRAPVLVQLQPHRAAPDLLLEPRRHRRVALAEGSRSSSAGGRSPAASAGRAGCPACTSVALVPVAGPVPPADERGHAARDRLEHLLRRR